MSVFGHKINVSFWNVVEHRIKSHRAHFRKASKIATFKVAGVHVTARSTSNLDAQLVDNLQQLRRELAEVALSLPLRQFKQAPQVRFDVAMKRCVAAHIKPLEYSLASSSQFLFSSTCKVVLDHVCGRVAEVRAKINTVHLHTDYPPDQPQASYHTPLTPPQPASSGGELAQLCECTLSAGSAAAGRGSVPCAGPGRAPAARNASRR